MNQNTPDQELYNLLVTRNFNPEKLPIDNNSGSATKSVSYKFDYKAQSGKDYGTAVAMIGNGGLTLYFGDNLGKSMDSEDKNGWFSFLTQLKNLAVRDDMKGGFNATDLSKLKYTMQGQAAIKEGLFESWAGTKTRSWNGMETEARLMIKHKRVIGENDARFRYIETLFVETAEGERYKLPFTKLSAGRAMVEHVRQGGKPYDIRGNHIAQIVEEMNVLSRFKRANQGKIFEGVTAQLVENAGVYYETLQLNLKSLSSKSGYVKYFEAWDPAAITDEDVIIEDLRHMFVEQNIDSRVEQALPLLARLQREQAMKEANIFEGWANLILEGTWALPDTKEKQAALIELLSQELPVGPDAINVTEQLYSLIGDDKLFEQLGALASKNADADAREIILNRLEELKDNPSVAQVIGELTNQTPEEPAQEVSESRGADYEFETEIINPAWLAWESTEETEDNPLPPEPEQMITVTVSYNTSGSYQPASWGDGGGSPAEGPEISIVSVIDNNTGEQIDPDSVVTGSHEDLRDKASADQSGMSEGSEDPLIQLKRSAGMKEDDMEEGWKQIAGAGALAAAAAFGGGGAQANDQIAKDTQAMGQAFRSGQMAPKQYAPGEISLSQIYSHPKWLETVQAMFKKYPKNHEDDQRAMNAAREAIKQMIQQGNVREGWKQIAGAGALTAAAALGGYAAGSHSPTGSSNTKGIEQFKKPTTSHVQPLKTQADLDAYNKTRPAGSSKLLNLPSDFEEEKEVDEGGFATAGKYIGTGLGALAGSKVSKGSKRGMKGGALAGAAAGEAGGQWIDDKISNLHKKSANPTPKPAQMTAESGNWLEGQYGHSGKMKPVEGGDEDTIARLKFLSGINK